MLNANQHSRTGTGEKNSRKPGSMPLRMFKKDVFTLGLMTVCFASFFTPAHYAVPGGVYAIWRAAMLVVSVLSVILYLRSCAITMRWACLVMFAFSYYLLSSYLARSDGSMLSAYAGFCKICGFISLMEFALSKDREMALRAFVCAGIIMCGVHYLTYVQYRDVVGGMNPGISILYGIETTQHWFFFTHDNGSVFYYLPVLGATWYRYCDSNKGLFPAVAASALTLFMYWSLWSVAAMLATTVAAVFYLIALKAKKSNARIPVSYRQVLFGGLLICAVTPLLNASDFLSSLTALFGKPMDGTRGQLWGLSWACIAASPVIGHGLEAQSTTFFKLGIDHCHNVLLQLLYTGGAVSMVFFFLGLYHCCTPRATSENGLSAGQLALCGSLIGCFIAATFDWYPDMVVQYAPFVLYAYSWMDLKSIRDDATTRVERHLPPRRGQARLRKTTASRSALHDQLV